MSSSRKIIWQEDEKITSCAACKQLFTWLKKKHHCRKCGLIFCDECSKGKKLIPKDLIVKKPLSNYLKKISIQKLTDMELAYNENAYQYPQRVCRECSRELEEYQEELRLNISKANQPALISPNRLPAFPSIDFYLENEIEKATIMLYNFKNSLGEDKIPKELLDISKGVIFLTVIKVGAMFTGRYGTGLIITKLNEKNNSSNKYKWSAPSALMITGLGWGLQFGAEVTNVMLILTTNQAVKTFQSQAQISIGTQLGVSIGPVGRSIKSEVAAGENGAAHAFSYAQSKGLFIGASLEASLISSRCDVNYKYYGEEIEIENLLNGNYSPPNGAELLYQAINEVLNFEEESNYLSNQSLNEDKKLNITCNKNDEDDGFNIIDYSQTQSNIYEENKMK